MPAHELASRGALEECVLFDAHAHLHPCFEVQAFLEGAAANFRAAARALGLPRHTPGLLFLADHARAEGFRRLADGPEEIGGWRLRPTGEGCSILAAHGAETLLLVAGRQVATREDLEVLALGTERAFREGRGFLDALEEAVASDALAVVPWGFGKWWFRRGRLVAAAIRSWEPGAFFLGDSGGRPRVLPSPRLFRLARARNLVVLPGSDPLPFPVEARVAGSYGGMLPVALAASRPVEVLKACLRKGARPMGFGGLEGFWRFLRHQVAMQRRKRRRSSVGD